MANVTFNFDAKFGFSLIDISTNGSPYSSSQQYSWVTPYGAAKVVFLGAGFAFDDDGYPSGGTVSQMTVNVSGGDVDMTVTGLSFDFKELSEEGYTKAQMYTILWHLVLAGDDLIDFSAILPNANAFQGTAFAGDGAGAGPEAVVEGGNDKIIGQFSFGTICGDLMSVSEYSSLHGGDDTIEMSGDANGKLFGDTTDVWGSVVGGNDRVSGGVGISKISGDVSFVSLGASLVGGDDTLNLTAPGTAIGDVEISFGGMISAGNDTISGSKGSDVLSGDIIRCDYRDYLRPGDDVIHGNGGDDQILGDWQEIEVGVRVKSTGTGNDLLYGDAGNDTVSGNSGNDVIFGGSGDDVLNGGDGRDTLAGASGADTFLFSAILKSANVDTVTDFNHAADSFELDNAVFAGMKAGKLASVAFTTIPSATSTAGVDGSDRILYDKAHGDLYFDRDGSASTHDRVLFAQVDDRTSVDHADFLIV